jgi:hypothetical protein
VAAGCPSVACVMRAAVDVGTCGCPSLISEIRAVAVPTIVVAGCPSVACVIAITIAEETSGSPSESTVATPVAAYGIFSIFFHDQFDSFGGDARENRWLASHE